MTIILCLLAGTVYDKTFYLSTTGESYNSGLTESKPWPTIGRLNKAISEKEIVGGDSILFFRGDTFNGHIFSERIIDVPAITYFGAYGNSSDSIPVIDGSIAIEEWYDSTINGVRVAVADISFVKSHVAKGSYTLASFFTDSIDHTPAFLFYDGNVQTLARFPDAGYLFIDKDGVDSTLFDSELSRVPSPDQWVGSTMVIRTIQWRYNHRDVVAINQSLGTLTSKGGKAPDAGWGYFLQGSLAGLSKAGEWFYDSKIEKLFFIPPVGVLAAQLTNRVRVSVFQNAIDIGTNFVAEDLCFKRYANSAVTLKSSSKNGVIRNCTISQSKIGISGFQVTGATIDGCFLQNIFSEGLQFWDCGRLKVLNNTIRSVGLDPGIEGWYFGISLGGNLDKMPLYNVGYLVRANRISKTGYSGITFISGDGKPGNGSVFEYNVIDTVCMTVGDGGAIYAGYSNSDTIRYNILRYGNGNADSWNFGKGGYKGDRYIFGINLMGDRDPLPASANSHIHHNVAAGFEAAFFCNKDIIGNLVEDNIFYNSRRSDILLKRISTGDLRQNNRFYRNTMYSFSNDLQNVTIIHNKQFRDETAIGTFDNNYYGNPYSILREHVRSSSDADSLGTLFYSSGIWQKEKNQELSGLKSAPYITILESSGVRFLLEDSTKGNLLGNCTFEDSIGAFETQGPALSIEQINSSKSKMLKFPNDTSSYFTRLISPGPLNLDSLGHYRLQFTITSKVIQRVTFYIADRQSKFGDGTIKTKVYSLLSTPYGNSYDWIIKVDSLGSNLRLHWRIQKMQGDCWLDNINFQKVKLVKAPDPEQISPLYINISPRDSLITLPSGHYRTISGEPVGSTLKLPPYSGQVLVIDDIQNVASGKRMHSVKEASRKNQIFYSSKHKCIYVVGIVKSSSPKEVAVYSINGKTLLRYVVQPIDCKKGIVSIRLTNQLSTKLVIVEVTGKNRTDRMHHALFLR